MNKPSSANIYDPLNNYMVAFMEGFSELLVMLRTLFSDQVKQLNFEQSH